MLVHLNGLVNISTCMGEGCTHASQGICKDSQRQNINTKGKRVLCYSLSEVYIWAHKQKNQQQNNFTYSPQALLMNRFHGLSMGCTEYAKHTAIRTFNALPYPTGWCAHVAATLRTLPVPTSLPCEQTKQMSASARCVRPSMRCMHAHALMGSCKRHDMLYALLAGTSASAVARSRSSSGSTRSARGGRALGSSCMHLRSAQARVGVQGSLQGRARQRQQSTYGAKPRKSQHWHKASEMHCQLTPMVLPAAEPQRATCTMTTPGNRLTPAAQAPRTASLGSLAASYISN